eukprot:6176233-Pleurochrysis_carterae.AAC.1
MSRRKQTQLVMENNLGRSDARDWRGRLASQLPLSGHRAVTHAESTAAEALKLMANQDYPLSSGLFALESITSSAAVTGARRRESSATQRRAAASTASSSGAQTAKKRQRSAADRSRGRDSGRHGTRKRTKV